MIYQETDKDYQHKLGQHYSSNTDLLKSYKSDLQKNNKIVYDPYVGKGHLIDYMLSIFTKDIAREKLLNPKNFAKKK